MWSITIINTYIDCIFVIFKCNLFLLFLYFYFFSLSFGMPLSYDRYWEAFYVEENENEGMLILHSIFLFLLLFLELYTFVDPYMLCNLNKFFVEISEKNCDAFILLFSLIILLYNVEFVNVLINYLFIFLLIILVEVSEKNCDAFIVLFFFANLTV